jgi:hypothetical protein
VRHPFSAGAPRGKIHQVTSINARSRTMTSTVRGDLKQHDLLIDGKRVPPGTGEYSVDINPATEEPIALVAQGSVEDVDTAVRAARAALKVWNGLPP